MLILGAGAVELLPMLELVHNVATTDESLPVLENADGIIRADEMLLPVPENENVP